MQLLFLIFCDKYFGHRFTQLCRNLGYEKYIYLHILKNFDFSFLFRRWVFSWVTGSSIANGWILASGIVSLFVLSKTRDQLSTSIFSGFQRVNKRIAAAAEKKTKLLMEIN